MSGIIPRRRISDWTTRCLIFLLLRLPASQGGCQFPKAWSGSWFQSGVIHNIHINATHIDGKGECYEEQGEKVIVYDRQENCYRCMAIHVKHPSVLQYKETFCDASAQDICFDISGDAPLYSMFRKLPEARPIACPFKSAPFTFQYNKGSDECTNPPSRAESCTDDSRLVLKYQACPDVPGTESNVEELICLAVWKEGSTRYLVGKISQWNRRALTTDEDQYRCFIYQRVVGRDSEVVYNIAQSGDASCNGITNALEGSKTMKLRTADNHHNRCKFPTWITDHHTWLSLDHKKTFKFSQRNSTLKIIDEDPKPVPAAPAHHLPSDPAFVAGVRGFAFGFEAHEQLRKRSAETRVVCHSILQAAPGRRAQVVAHVTRGCDSGHVCLVFHRRDAGVVEMQRTGDDGAYAENAEDACRDFDPATAPYTTLITTSPHAKACPHLGRYVLDPASLPEERRRARQHLRALTRRLRTTAPQDDRPPDDPLAHPAPPPPPPGGTPECASSHEFEALAAGCGGAPAALEFRTPCAARPTAAYACHGGWRDDDDGTHYVIASPLAARKPASEAPPMRYCFVYTFRNGGAGGSGLGGGGGSGGGGDGGVSSAPTVGGGAPVLMISGVAGNCDRGIVPGVKGTWAFNFTSNGTCAESSSTSGAISLFLTAALEVAAVCWAVIAVLR